MPSSDKERLLNDILRNADYAEFRAEVYDGCLAEFKAGRPRPVKEMLLAVAAVALVAGAIFVAIWPGKDIPLAEQARSNPMIVVSGGNVPVVRSAPLNPAEVVRSVSDRSLLLDTQLAGFGPAQKVASVPASVSELQDAELLALLSNDSVGILSAANGENLFYFANGPAPRLE